MKDPAILILDTSPSQIYSQKHIPGAMSVDLFKWYGLKEISDADVEKLFQSWGIDPNRKIVMYDQGGTFWATRLFFSLYYYGFPEENLFILDGGFSKWEEMKMPVTKDVIPVTKGSYKIKNVNRKALSELPEFLNASGDTESNVLLEALDPEWHYGGYSIFDKAGHIPNAVLTPAIDYFKPDKTFKAAVEIERMLKYLNINREQNIYTHCGGGIAASVPFFALKFILDYPKVQTLPRFSIGMDFR